MNVTLRKVSASYLGHPVLEAIGLTLHRRTALLGANGSGKTTLLRVVSGAHEPDAGQVLVDGVPLKHSRAGLRAHRRRVQLVSQDPDDQLFSADVAQDVSFGPTNLGLAEHEVRARVDEALQLLRITHLADRPTHHLSFGERKRAAIAGAVAMRPEMLLLDEPTSGLDPFGVAELLETLAGLEEQGTTLVMATHDVDLAFGWAHEAGIVTGHRVIQGSSAELLNDLELLHRARLHRPWPLELSARLAAAGLVPDGATPRTLSEMATLLIEGPNPVPFPHGDPAK